MTAPKSAQPGQSGHPRRGEPGAAGQMPAQKAMKQFSKQSAERGEPDSGDGQARPPDAKPASRKDPA